jgi:hypothetical protein
MIGFVITYFDATVINQNLADLLRFSSDVCKSDSNFFRGESVVRYVSVTTIHSDKQTFIWEIA